ncbi:hypothetical protein ACM46_11070 [Chryseobacterium angstadtii]|uniref:Lanthionine synthetase n=1 Tax=Chryseobacterium angstadtii TaxID=558151 RepID=A0A0J7IE97_9FLAO|nr:lanthionine synthetase LanC family protein [Chryseobacterium angstadtii]KMQ64768.1 hypothetical protein ACM46_11070 [Chryseobacterium angstadtii]
MMKDKELHELQNGLNEIREFLLSKRKKDTNGFYWDTIAHDPHTGEVSFTFNSSLWNGTGGIAWFFLLLYENFGNKDDLKTAEGSFSKIYVYSKDEKISNPSLYDGICGVIYLGLELYRVTQKDLYLQQTLELYDLYRQKIIEEQTEDLLIGTSGILIAVCSLYHYTKDERLYRDINVLINSLLEKAQIAEAGIKWGRNHLSVDSLCGFSHGNSGIAFSLLQIGKYFNHQELIWLAEQAFLYEDLYDHPQKNNWMDLRWENSKAQLSHLFEWDKNTFLQDDFDLNAWAHGACGIGSARMSAFRITHDPKYKEDCIRIFKRCKNDIRSRSKQNHILFSGYGGISDFLLQFHELFDDTEALDLAQEIVFEGLEKSRSHHHAAWGVQKTEDLGLMTGTAGIGFSMLTIIKGKTFNSILHPELPVEENKPRDFILSEDIKVKKSFFGRFYPKTLEILQHDIPSFRLNDDFQTVDEFGDFLLKTIEELPEKEAEYLSDIHQFETKKINIRKKHKGALCFQTRLRILKEELNEYLGNGETDLQKKQFVRNPFIHIHESKWNWNEENPKESDAGQYHHIFYSTDQEIFHLTLEPFLTAVLQLLENPLSIEELAAYFHYSEGEKERIEKKLTEQILELLKNFFIRTK